MSNIRDVAESAQVSPATVSRVLNGKASALVSEATRQRVLQAAHTLGYTPSAAARALVAGRTDTVALATANIHDPHYTRALEAAQSIVDEFGYHLLLLPSASDERLRKLLRERRADVVLRLRWRVDVADDIAAAAVSDEQAVIAVGPVDEHPPEHAQCAYWDDREGIAAAVRHLIDLGHREVAMLVGSVAQRKLHYAQEAAGSQLEILPVCLGQAGEDDVAWGAALAERALKLYPAATALLAQNDNFALGALHWLNQAGIRIPEQISVMGYNDILMAAYSHPPLTTVRTPLVECIERTLRQVLGTLSKQNRAVQPQAVQLPVKLVVRATTAPPNGHPGGV